MGHSTKALSAETHEAQISQPEEIQGSPSDWSKSPGLFRAPAATGGKTEAGPVSETAAGNRFRAGGLLSAGLLRGQSEEQDFAGRLLLLPPTL